MEENIAVLKKTLSLIKKRNQNNSDDSNTNSNALILYEAFYSNSKVLINPEKINIPSSLAPKQNLEEIFLKNKKFSELPNGFQLYLSLFYRNDPQQTYSIHGLWLNKYQIYQNTINFIEVNSDINITNTFLIHKINPLVIQKCNVLWSSGLGYPPNIQLWEHEYGKHGTAIQKNLFPDIKPDNFLVTVIDLYEKATKKVNGQSLADLFLGDTKIGETLLIPVTLSLELLYTGYTKKIKRQLKELRERSVINNN